MNLEMKFFSLIIRNYAIAEELLFEEYIQWIWQFDKQFDNNKS